MHSKLPAWPYDNWFGAGLDAWALGTEASTVIALRTARIAMGGAAALDEVNLMFSEKMAASIELQTAAMTGGLGLGPADATRKAIGFYRRKVRANRRRLTKG